jgi:antitoxin (DNA-binding transcriptional repressor) of toxin-antitoxin stability system
MASETNKAGVREIKEHASEIARRVREGHEVFECTYRGETFARIIPIAPRIDPLEDELIWQERERLVADTSAHWKDDQDAVETGRCDPSQSATR